MYIYMKRILYVYSVLQNMYLVLLYEVYAVYAATQQREVQLTGWSPKNQKIIVCVVM